MPTKEEIAAMFDKEELAKTFASGDKTGILMKLKVQSDFLANVDDLLYEPESILPLKPMTPEEKKEAVALQKSEASQ